MKVRYRTSEKWAQETDWLGVQPLGNQGDNLINMQLAAAEVQAGWNQDDEEDIDTAPAPRAAAGQQGTLYTGLMGHAG